MSIKIELPPQIIEPLFSALSVIRPNTVNKVEIQAVHLLKTLLFLELEMLMQTKEEKEKQDINFQNLFEEERERRRKARENTDKLQQEA